MSQLDPGTQLDGYVIDTCIHSSSRADIYRVHPAAPQQHPGFELVMKVPRAAAADGIEKLIGFEIESQILQAVTGPQVPRFVAAGDLARQPYLVQEYVQGHTLQERLDADPNPVVDDIARLGAALANAVHALHQQNTVHQDLKPSDVLIRGDGTVALLDFELACHAHYPDLLAERTHKAIGSPASIAPEQVVGVRGDLRSDIFAIGVMLYLMCTNQLPFGQPQTDAGLRRRLWVDPRPPRSMREDIPAWLQEVVLRCLEPEAARRYQSAALLAFDLTHPHQVRVTARGHSRTGTHPVTHIQRWFRASGMHYRPSPLPEQQISEVPIVMVALPHKGVTEATLCALRQAVERTLGTRPGARLTCVTVIAPDASNDSTQDRSTHRRFLSAMHQWSLPLDSTTHQMSFEVLESNDIASALLHYARDNSVSVIVMGAATHGLKTQHFIATIPIKVAIDAPCTVILVKQATPSDTMDTAPTDESLPL